MLNWLLAAFFTEVVIRGIELFKLVHNELSFTSARSIALYAPENFAIAATVVTVLTIFDHHGGIVFRFGAR